MESLTEDEIIRDWSLDQNDKTFVRKFNNNYRLWVYLQLCSLRLFGQLLENPNTLNSQVIGHACKALELPIVATVPISDRGSTKTDHKKLIFEHLNFRRFEDSTSIFQSWLKEQSNSGLIIQEHIQKKAEEFLVKNKIALPTQYSLKRDIDSFCRQSQETLFDHIHSQLSPSFIKTVDDMLFSPEKGSSSWFQKFKEYPGSATISRLQHYLTLYKKLSEIPLGVIEVPGMSLELTKHLYQLGRYYDAWKIKRFKPGKRYSVMLIFLVESKKVVMDYIIQMHDQYITNICRACKNIHETRLKQYITPCNK